MPMPSLAQAFLGRSHIPSLWLIQVKESEDGIVVTGRVSTYRHRDLALEVVGQCCQGRRILNCIRVQR